MEKDKEKIMNETKEDPAGRCPYVTAQKVISGKWTILILHYLSEGTLRFGQLQRKIPDLTQATLTKQLRTLESNGMIQRIAYPEVPPRVEYSLTPIGTEFNSVLSSLELWELKYLDYLEKSSSNEAKSVL